MKRLTENEINFIKETGVTPTVMQCDEWYRSQCSNYDDAEKLAYSKYGVDLNKLFDNLIDRDYDIISLENDATYLLYIFLTRKELENMSKDKILEWLQDFKYFCGYRKYDVYAADINRYEALEVYKGMREFYEDFHGAIWSREIEN